MIEVKCRLAAKLWVFSKNLEVVRVVDLDAQGLSFFNPPSLNHRTKCATMVGRIVTTTSLSSRPKALPRNAKKGFVRIGGHLLAKFGSDLILALARMFNTKCYQEDLCACLSACTSCGRDD